MTRFSLAGALALFGCDYFDDVTIPAADTTPPIAIAQIIGLDDGTNIISFTGLPAVSKTVASPNQGWLAVAAAADAEGAYRVTMRPEVVRTCRVGDLQATSFAAFDPVVEEQVGASGDVVSNGVYTGMYVKMSEFTGGCPAGTTLAAVSFTWEVTAENYFDGTATHGSARIRFAP